MALSVIHWPFLALLRASLDCMISSASDSQAVTLGLFNRANNLLYYRYKEMYTRNMLYYFQPAKIYIYNIYGNTTAASQAVMLLNRICYSPIESHSFKMFTTFFSRQGITSQNRHVMANGVRIAQTCDGKRCPYSAGFNPLSKIL